jgi:hypothetical protein
MLAIILDPCFKSLKVVENYVGWGACICLACEYDAIVMIPFLMIIFEIINHIVG